MDFKNISDGIRAVLVSRAFTTELIEVLEEAPCTCSNPDPGDWPHNQNNTQCYRRRLIDALQNTGLVK